MENPVLLRFRRFKETLIATDVPNSVLLDMLESYLCCNNDDKAAEALPALDGQLSLFDLAC